MGRRSTRENKTIYQQKREEAGLTLEEASALSGGLSAERIARIERGTVRVQPEDAILMAECYKAPVLCNHYCTHECAIGRASVPEIEDKSIETIAVETLNCLNKLTRERDRLLEIVEDGQVLPNEVSDFVRIKKTLDKISASVQSLRLWVDSRVAEGKLDPADFDQ